MAEPEIVWLLQKRRVGQRSWEVCWGNMSVRFSKADADAAAERFTDASIGWKYRARAFKEVMKCTEA
jgi:hypothetical protein